jgi:hypothetical protein
MVGKKKSVYQNGDANVKKKKIGQQRGVVKIGRVSQTQL